MRHCSWCGPCRSIAPYFTELAAAHKDITFVKIDVDENGSTAEEVRGVDRWVTLMKKKGQLSQQHSPPRC